MFLTLSQKKQIIKNRKTSASLYNYDRWAREEMCSECGREFSLGIAGICKDCVRKLRLMWRLESEYNSKNSQSFRA